MCGESVLNTLDVFLTSDEAGDLRGKVMSRPEVNIGDGWVRFEQSQLPGAEEGPLFVVDPQLAVHLLNVPLDRTKRQSQPLSNFWGGVTLRQQDQDLAFAAGQWFDQHFTCFIHAIISFLLEITSAKVNHRFATGK